MRVDNSAGKGTSGMDKFGSVIDRMNMKLGKAASFLTLRNKTQLLKRPQRVIVVDKIKIKNLTHKLNEYSIRLKCRLYLYKRSSHS
jgi:hypothetical protein